MYKLYYSAGSCAMGIHALLNELKQPVDVIKRDDVPNYRETINPTNGVPVLADSNTLIREGAAIAIYLMEKHKSDMLPASGLEKAHALEWLMFANATVHPAYSKLFGAKRLSDQDASELVMKTGVEGLNKLWKIVDEQLAKTPFVTGQKMTMADIFLTVYANWNGYFPVEVKLGDNVKRMIKEVSARPAFKEALSSEQVEYKAA